MHSWSVANSKIESSAPRPERLAYAFSGKRRGLRAAALCIKFRGPLPMHSVGSAAAYAFSGKRRGLITAAQCIKFRGPRPERRGRSAAA